MDEKKCTKCGAIKPVDLFPLVQRKSGPKANSWCDQCCSAQWEIYRQSRLKKSKSCTKCGTEKTLADFPPCPKLIDGRSSWCRDCHSVLCAAWRRRRIHVPKLLTPGRTCAKCKEYKVRLLFSPSKVSRDGLQPWCKKCVASDKKAWRNYSEENRERDRLQRQRHNLTDKAKATRKRFRSTAEHKLRHAARTTVRVAIEAGIITKPDTCSMADHGGPCKGRIEGHHHNGYSLEHWLDVVWLCQSHHRMIEECSRPTSAISE